jgi:hypothetical protein
LGEERRTSYAKPAAPHLELRLDLHDDGTVGKLSRPGEYASTRKSWDNPSSFLVKPRRLCNFGFHVHNPPGIIKGSFTKVNILFTKS